MAELVSKTYSEAIFDVAVEEGRLDDIQREFEFVTQTLIEYPEFNEIIRTPKIGVSEKKIVILETFENHISQTLLN